MIKVFLVGTAEELFQLNMNLVSSIGDELMLGDEPYMVTGRRFVLEDIQRDMKNVDYTILYVRRTW
jgi:hypothetical protein